MTLLSFCKYMWLCVCLVVLLMTLYASNHGSQSDIGIFFVVCMIGLTFPVGILLAVGVTALVVLQEWTGIPILDFVESNLFGTLLMWITFVAAGYWQWFKAVPRLLKFGKQAVRNKGRSEPQQTTNT